MQIKPKSNIDEALAVLKAYQQKAQNLSPAFAEIANLLLNETEDAFDAETDPVTGQVWEPLSAATLAAKQGKGKPLYDDGKMQESLNVYSDNERAIVGFSATAKGYEYPAVHHFGTDDDKVPQRRALPFDDDGDITPALKDGVIDLVVEHFREA